MQCLEGKCLEYGCLTTPQRVHQWPWLLQQFLAKDNILQVWQLPYSPYLALCNVCLFKNQITLERNKISRCRGNLRECDDAAAHYPKNISWMLLSMETMQDKVCNFLKEIKFHIDVCCFLFITLFPIFFEQPSYMDLHSKKIQIWSSIWKLRRIHVMTWICISIWISGMISYCYLHVDYCLCYYHNVLAIVSSYLHQVLVDPSNCHGILN